METDGEDDVQLRDLLAPVRTIAVLGIKTGPADDAFRVPAYLQAQGCRIIPVNPKHATVLGEPCVRTLGEIEEPIDLVNVFRASHHIPAHADEILALQRRPAAAWLQLGIECPASAERLADAGIAVIQNRCLMVDHRRLFGGSA